MFKINNHKISASSPPFIVAKLSANHNGELSNALKAIKMARDTRADAIKIQTYTPETITIQCSKRDFMIKSGL